MVWIPTSTVMVRVLAAFGAVALSAVVAPATADASRIVLGCGEEICAVDPDTGATDQITTDGASKHYRYPDISRDGSTVAAASGDDVLVGPFGSNPAERRGGSRDINDVAISPDGSALAESHSYVENRYGCPLTGGCLELVDMSGTTYSSAGGEHTYAGGGGAGFLGNGALLSSGYSLGDDANAICVVPNPAGDSQPCEARIIRKTSEAGTLGSPTGSPDSMLIAVTVGAPQPSQDTSVQLFDAATGAHVRTLAEQAGSPTFSPDGKQVAYSSAGSIWTVPVAGGKPTKLVQGVSPSWGGGSVAGASVRSRSLRYRKGKIAITVRCKSSSSCRGSLRVRKGKSVLGSRSYRIQAGKRATISVKPTSRGRRTLARAGKQRVTVTLKPTGGKTASTKLTLRR